MNKAEMTDCDHIDFLIGAQRVCSCAEAERVQPDESCSPAHDAFTRQLNRLLPGTERLWPEVREHADLRKGCLICDDSALDKLRSRRIELVTRHWSGKHQQVVAGMNLITPLWTDGGRHPPADCRICNKLTDGLTKSDHFREMPLTAAKRGFSPKFILSDSWHASLDNLKMIRSLGWLWPTRLASSRHINPDKAGNRPVRQAALPEQGGIVHLEGYGMVKAFKKVSAKDGIECRAANDLKMTGLIRLKHAEMSWMIETHHRGIKQFCGVERCQARSERARRNHVELALRAFLRLECHCFAKGISWFEAEISIVRDAVRACLKKPIYTLEPVIIYATA